MIISDHFTLSSFSRCDSNPSHAGPRWGADLVTVCSGSVESVAVITMAVAMAVAMQGHGVGLWGNSMW